MALFDADVIESGDSLTLTPEAVDATPARLPLASRLWSKANAMYCPMCGEDLSVAASALSPGSGRYCVEDHSLSARN